MKTYLKIFFLIYVIVFPDSLLFGQEYIRYDIADGLSSNEITCVCQDKNYFWIGTTNGLCRYDGQNFKIYRKSGIKKSLISNHIETLMVDSKGCIWIGYKTNGVEIFCPEKEEFFHLSDLTKDRVPHHVISIFEDSQKNIWLGAWDEGVFKVSMNIKNKDYQITNHYYGYTISSFLEEPTGFVWIGTFYGGFIHNMKYNNWQNFGNNSTISSVVSSGDNSIYYSTWEKGLHKIEYIANDSISIEKDIEYYSGLGISKMILSQNNTLIAGTWGNGIKSIQLNKNREPQDLTSIVAKNIYVDDLSLDNKGSVWISTYGNGLLKFPCTPNIIRSILLPLNVQAPVSELYRLYGQKLIVGTRGSGNFIYDISNQSFIPFSLKKKNQGNAYLLSAYQTTDLLLLGDDDQGLSYRASENSSDKTLYQDNQLNKVSAIYSDGNKYWFGTKQNGFFSADYNLQSDSFENIKQNEILGKDEITGFLPNKNKLWISSHNGLYLYNLQTENLEEYASNPLTESVYCIAQAPSSDLIWLATSSGVRYFDPKEKKVSPILFYSVMPEGAVKTLKMDSGHNLWFSIGNRLFCYKNSDNNTFEINLKGYISSPIISTEIVSDQYTECLYLGSSEGITVVDLHKLLKSNEQQKIVFTDLKIDLNEIQVGDSIYGKIPLYKSTENIEKLELSYQCKWISFYFSELGNDILKRQYQYRIVGFSDAWKSFDITRPITISQLSPGNYLFEIRNYSETQPDNTYNIVWDMKLEITPPFWQTTWFFLLIVLLAMLFLASISYYLIRNYRRNVARRISRERRQQELELLKEKESFFMGLSHDILTPFMLIQSPAKDLVSDSKLSDENKEKAKIIHKNASFLSNMFSTILDFKKTKEEIRNTDIVDFELVYFTSTIINSFIYLARSKDIQLEFSSCIDTIWIKTDKVKLERILYNLLSNALKYTNKEGKVSLQIIQNTDKLELKIEDNGIGIAIEDQDRVFEKFYQIKQNPSSQSNNFGLGLYIVKSFVSQIGGNVILDSQKGKGTMICIQLPIDLIVESNNKAQASDLSLNQIENISDNSKPVLLLVEDHIELRDYLICVLNEHFYVVAATNGMEALPLARKIIPEIIISDLMMPEMDGLTLCRKVKEDELLADSFFVLLTAKNSSEDEIQSYKDGVDIFIRKPIDADLLIKQMTNIASTRLKRRKQIMHTLLLQKGDISQLKPKDAFIREVMKIVDENMVNPDFKLDDLAEQMHLSKTVLHRKFKDILDETPNQFIRNVRLKKAEDLLLKNDLTISEIAYLTGFNQSHYFIKCFKEVYNDTPKNYRQKYEKK